MRKKEWISGIRQTDVLIWAIAVLLLFTLWLGLWVHFKQERDIHLIERTSQNESLARIFEEHVNRVMRGADFTLRQVEAGFALKGRRLDLEQFAKRFDTELDPYTTLNILDSSGTVILSSLKASVGINFKNNDNVRHHRVTPGQDLFISTTRRGTAAQDWTVFLSHRIDNPDGTHAGNSSLGLKAQYFTQFYGELGLGAGTRISVVGLDAKVRVSAEDGAFYAGLDLSKAPLFQKYLPSSASGSYYSEQITSGQKRLYSYRKVKDYPLVVVISRPAAVLLAPFEDYKFRLSAAAGVLSLVLLMLAVLLHYFLAREVVVLRDLSLSEERLRLALQSADQGIYDLDLVSGNAVVSPEYARMLGYDPATFVETNAAWAERMHPDERERVFRTFEAYVRGEIKNYRVEFRQHTGSGEWKWVLSLGAIVSRSADGRPLRMIGTHTNIDARKQAELALHELNASLETRVVERTRDLERARDQAEAALLEAERANLGKSEFLSRMSHELRTPMNAILGFAQVLESEPLNAEQAQFVREIGAAGDHLLTLINDLLDLSRIESGHMAVVVQPADLGVVVGQSVKLVGALLQERKISLTEDCAGQYWVLADETRLRQVLVNLLSNAAKYNRQGGAIGIACEERGGGRLRLKVIDTGSGIAPEKLGDLFKPFERLGAERTGVDGIGIGLTLSKRLVEMMGGQIGVESEPGRGSTFWVELGLVGTGQA